MTQPQIEYFCGNKNDRLAADHRSIIVDRFGIFLCLEGKAEMLLDGRHYAVGKQSITMYFPRTELRVLYRSDDLNGVVVTLDLESLQPLLNKVTDVCRILDLRMHPTTELTDEDATQIKMYFTQFLYHQELSTKYSDPQTRRLWQLNALQQERIKECLMLQVVKAFSNEKSFVHSAVGRRDDIVRHFLTLLRQSYVAHHEVSFYADSQCLSMRYFSNIIRQRTGRTPSQWIAASLLADARRLLLDSKCTVKQVSDQLNFPNQSYFGKWFKQQVGQSPYAFRLSAGRGEHI